MHQHFAKCILVFVHSQANNLQVAGYFACSLNLIWCNGTGME